MEEDYSKEGTKNNSAKEGTRTMRRKMIQRGKATRRKKPNST